MAAKHIPTESSMIRSATYDPETQTLSVSMFHGGVYETPGITQAQADEFQTAPSQGKWWIANCRDKKR
jgi:hypothetical protein